ncbi:MAG: hypothetical protein DMG27_10155 [Acidobacteria bacterium]|nr:MAG: hypothetical protein DMG27_10155 [Acidobacteriota bacterium]
MTEQAPRGHGADLSKQMGYLPLVAVIFFTVSGGAYGIESLVGSLDAGWAMALIVLTPLFWALPIALMVSELASALPEEGGYYVWVRQALGDFWGFQEGWWTICYTAVDMAIYPVLFVDYLAYFCPSLALSATGSASSKVLLGRWLVALAVIVSAYLANWRGVRVVGASAAVTAVLVLAPFGLFALLGLHRPGALPAAFSAVRTGLARRNRGSLLALGMSTVLWNYCGWDNVSTFAAEVKQAARNYPRALILALVLIVIGYVAPVMAGISATTDPALWNESAGWPSVARLVAGPWLGMLVAAMALVSAWSLFNSQLLYASRLPYAMARDGWLPSLLARLSSTTGMPAVALAAVCSTSALLAVFPFTKLVVIDILLYSAGLLLEFLALIALRVQRPDMDRPFRLPGGWPGVLLATLCPVSFAAVVAVASVTGDGGNRWQAALVGVFILAGALLYRWRRQSPSPAK